MTVHVPLSSRRSRTDCAANETRPVSSLPRRARMRCACFYHHLLDSLKSVIIRSVLYSQAHVTKIKRGKATITYLALGAGRVMVLRFGPLATIKCLMSHEIVHGSELDAARGADQLHERRRGCARWRWARVTARGTAALASLTVMLFMGHEVLVFTEYNVALFTSADGKREQDG
ncbi:unnamed protein product [Trichogramma brassicae]|uniref:Uncharacterized protein n=1 Tax=Trichogramma brassicae TaxID=86971 RepID=A0A6H5I9C8_9HYME|nr:unnamed protein product [Trichogramma brassicae]